MERRVGYVSIAGISCFLMLFHLLFVNPNPFLLETRSSSIAKVFAMSPHTNDNDFCVNNSRKDICCSNEHCNLVKRSTLYSECCANLPIAPPIHRSHATTKHRIPPSRIKEATRIYPILISATPRSGTVFLQSLLKKLGIIAFNDMQTPRRYMNVMVSWMHIFKDDVYYGPTNLYGSKFQHVLHQVRDPLKSLTSLAFTEPLKTDHDYLDFVSRHIKLTDVEKVQTILKQQQLNSSSNIKAGASGNHTSRLLKQSQDEQFLIFRGMEMYLQWQRYLLDLSLPRHSLEDLTVHCNFTAIYRIFRILKRSPPSEARLRDIVHSMQRRRRRRTLLLQQQQRNKKHTNSRRHRPTLDWDELCQVHVDMTQQFLTVSHELGYYLDKSSVCQ